MFKHQLDLRVLPYTRCEAQTIYTFGHRYNNPISDIVTQLDKPAFEKIKPSYGLLSYMFDSYARQDLVDISPGMFWNVILSRIGREVFMHPLQFIDFFIANGYTDADIIPRTRPCVMIHDSQPSPSTSIDILNIYDSLVHKLNLKRLNELCNIRFSTDTDLTRNIRTIPVLQMLNVYYDIDVVRPVIKKDEYRITGSPVDFQGLLDFTDINTASSDPDDNDNESADHQTLVDALDDLFDLFSPSPHLQRYLLKANLAVQKLHDSFEEFFIPASIERGASQNRIYGSVCDLYDIPEGSCLTDFDNLDISQFLYRNIHDGSRYVTQGFVVGSYESKPVYGLLNYPVFK